jgi:hypothetical protein
MNFITTRAHALLDYLFGIALFASPWIVGFTEADVPKAIALILGLAIGLMSLFTRYEGGLIPVIPFSAHLLFDILCGIFLIVSPWLLGFRQIIFMPFIAFGSVQLLVALLTHTKTGTRPNPDRVIP